MKENLINRKMYKTVKKYDHAQMEEFISNIYTDAYNAGRTEGRTETLDSLAEERMKEQSRAANINTDNIKAKLTSVKGIGEKKITEIMRIISEEMGM